MSIANKGEQFILTNSDFSRDLQNSRQRYNGGTLELTGQEYTLETNCIGVSSLLGSGKQQQHIVLTMENEKKMRRQIANSNERRRMQSINAGFQSLRTLLPHHEGEKLSKAAILQQTAEYIYNLEQEKTQLLSQNCYLKRLLDQHDVAQDLQQTSVAAVSTITPVLGSTTTTALPTPIAGGGSKKRKLDAVMTMQTASDSSDEGLGSMSPEPLTIVLSTNSNSKALGANVTTGAQITAKELLDIKQVDRCRLAHLTSGQGQDGFVAYLTSPQHSTGINLDADSEILDACDDVEIEIENDLEEEQESAVQKSVDVTVAPLPKKKRPTIVETTDDDGLPMKKEIHEIQVLPYEPELVMCSPFHEISYDSSDLLKSGVVGTSKLSKKTTNKVFSTMSSLEAELRIKEEPGTANDKMSTIKHNRLQPILESLNKAEPKVEVERISNSPIPLSVAKEEKSRMYITATSTSRQNLETIVEAIRHLEGDAMFEETPASSHQLQQQTVKIKNDKVELPTQDMPLALTTHNKNTVSSQQSVLQFPVEMNSFLQFRPSPSSVNVSPCKITTATVMKQQSITLTPAGSVGSAQIHHLQQCRPGVIVVKQNS